MSASRVIARLRFVTYGAIGVVVLLGLAVLLSTSSENSRAHHIVTRVWMTDVSTACAAYKGDLGEYPAASSAEELRRTLISEQNSRGPYLDPGSRGFKRRAVDLWGTPYLYERSPDGQSFRLGSAGPDKEFGTDDDIIVEPLKPKKQEARGED